MSIEESKEKFPNLIPKNRHKEKINVFKYYNDNIKNNFENKDKKTNLNEIVLQRNRKLKPINLINFYGPERIINNNDIVEKENNGNFIIKKDIIKDINTNKNKKLKKLFSRNKSSLSYNQMSKDSKTKIEQQIQNQFLSNKIKKLNLLNNSRLLNTNSRVKSNYNFSKKNFSSDNISLSNESKKNLETSNDKDYLKRKKIFSSKSKSSQNIFLANIDIRSVSSRGRKRKENGKKYKKKWNLPKIMSFDKITGRYKKNKNPIKFHEFERMYDYSPKYDVVKFNDQKVYLNLGLEKNIKFKNYKINITRKYLCNRRNLINSSGDYYNILRVLKEEKEKKNKIKSELGKKFNIIEEYKYYNNKYY